MALFANVVRPLFVVNKPNLRPIACVINTGVYTTHECGVVMSRGIKLQPIQSSGGSSAPTGPQRWPL